MIKIKKPVFIILMMFFSGHIIAQVQYQYEPFDNTISKDFAYGGYDRKELEMDSYDKDHSARALVLKEYGKAAITSNGNVSSLTYEYHVRIKIFDSKALNSGVIELPFYVQDNGTYEEISTSNIQATTFYMDENGATRESVLSPDSIYTVKNNKHWSMIKFNMPNVRNGCIIEYKYKLDSPFLNKFRTWDFQSDIPKVSSKFEAHIPNVFAYNVSLHGALKFSKDSIAVEKDCFESTNLKSDCTVEDYEMVNIPAFKPEPYMSSPKNFLSSLHFQVTESTKLNNYANLNQASQQDVGASWEDVDKMLRYFDNFGNQLTRKSIFKDRLTPVTAGKTDTLEKAKAVYAYIQKNISFNGLYDIYSDEGIKKALDKHTGNSADINLALVTALNAAGLYADAVIMSTRNNGIPGKLYPAPTEFNYVIAITKINGKTYLLDATDPLLTFGMLPFRALNDQGRVIPIDKPSYWINIVTPQRNINTYNLDISIADNGKLKGTLTHYAIGYAGYEKRNVLKNAKTAGINTIVKGVKLSNAAISNADSLDEPLAEVYNVEFDNPTTFSPIILDKLTENPFKATTRTYPVDFGMPAATSFTLTLHLPDGYTIENPPQSVTDTLANNGGGLNAVFENNGNTVTYTLAYHLDKSNFPVAEYPALKNFFDKIVLSENTIITVKKK